MHVQTIPVSQIDFPAELLRDVEVDTEHYKAFVTAIEEEGLLHPITVRPKAERFELVAGAHRLSAVQQLGHEVIPCVVRDLDDTQAYAVRIMENAARLEATPLELARHLYRILTMSPDMTQVQLAHQVGRSTDWVRRMLHLNRLCRKVQRFVDSGEVCVSNAFELSKLPEKMQEDFLLDAMSMKVGEFKDKLRPIMRQLQADYGKSAEAKKLAKREGLQPFMRPISNLQSELATKSAATTLLTQCKARTPLDGWILALRWCMNDDPIRQKERQSQNKKADDSEFSDIFLTRRETPNE